MLKLCVCSSHTMFSLFHSFLLLLFFSTKTYSLNSSSPFKNIESSNDVYEIDTVFKFPFPIPAWPEGGNFAKGAIDLGGLQVKSISSFKKLWKANEGGPDRNGASLFEPSPIPDGYFMIGSYAQSNGKQLYGSVLVAKDLIQGALKPPIDYELVWTSETTETSREGDAYMWLPIAPAGYEPLGYVVTNDSEQPPFEKIMCVRSDFTETCENDDWIWADLDIQINGMKPTARGPQAQGLSPGTFNIVNANNDSYDISCLKNIKNDLSSMPNLDQVNALIKAYSPWVVFHPDEEFFPSSVSWFWKNGALLYKRGDESNPVKIEPTGLNLPMNGTNDGSFWMDLPRDDAGIDRVRKGDLQDAGGYFHIKPMFGGTYTDIVVWLFYPFNGNAKAQIAEIRFSLGRIGEHVGDWEHITLRVSNLDGELKSIYLSQHKNGIWWPIWDLLYKDGNKPMIFACLHSHAHEPFPVSELYKGFLDIGILKQAEGSDFILDTGAKFLIISAEYLGPSIVEAPWLNFMNEWGPKIDYDIKQEIKSIHDTLPGFLREGWDKITSKLPEELLGQEGPLGPKMKDNWNGDEDI